MLTPDFLKSKFAAAKPYADYLASGTPEQRDKWSKSAANIRLTDAQRTLIASFPRTMHVLVSSGIWCGDCSAQCPMLAAIGAANPARIHVRFLDCDAHADLASQITICSGTRVPTAVFMNEDFDFMSLLGDKTLARLRASAAKKLGAACELPGMSAPADETAATLQDWLNEFERVQLLCRLSTKLRARHGD